jgi:phenylalanyl-tRNA synthetase beta chain
VLFELGHVFSKDVDGDTVPEPLHLAAVLTGQRDVSWAGDGAPLDGRDAAALVATVARACGRDLRIVNGDAPGWAHPGVYARVLLNDAEVGRVGALHPERLDAFEIEDGVAFFELDLGAILDVPAAERRHAGVPRTQASTRDVALILPASVSWAQVATVVDGFRHKFLEGVRLFDVYEGPGVDAGHRSLALRSTWRKADGSLTDKQVEKGQTALVAHLTEGLDARVRS